MSAIRFTRNAAPVAPAAAATAEIFAAGERINITTDVANQQIRAQLVVSRDNAAAAGNGTYRFLVDGVAAGEGRVGPTGTDLEGGCILDEILTIAAPGAHTVSARVTSNTDVETVSAVSFLTVTGGR